MKTAAVTCLAFIIAIYAFPASGFARPSDEVNPNQLLKASLTVSAKLYFGDEDEESEPVADAAFYLLRKSTVEVLRNGKFEFADDEQAKDDESYLQAAALAFLPSNREDAEIVGAFVALELAKHQQAEMKTDSKGSASLNQISPGNYYLFGMTRSEESVLVWNLPVTIKPGTNSIELDQHNADSVFTIED